MFDITKYIKLNKSERKTYTILRLFLIAGFLVGGTLFAKELFFPTQVFQFKNSINSLANTISRPYESSKGTSFHIMTQGESNYVKFTIKLPKDSPKLPDGTILTIKKSYLAFLSPINKEKYTDHIVKTYETPDAEYLENQNGLHKFANRNAFNSYLFKDNTNLQSIPTEQLSNISDELIGFTPATLISSKDSIYIIDQNKKHPFQDERSFLTLGYNFDNVIKTTTEERSMYKKAKLFTTTSTHPFGTLFYATDSENIFMFDNNLLNKLPTTALAKQHAIITQEASRITEASCALKKTLFPRQYKCKTSIDTINAFHGNTYQFTLKDAPNTQIESSKIKLFTTPSKKSLKNRFDSIKRKLDTNYN